MPKKNNENSSLLPPEVIDHWPEVFDHIDIEVIPLEYLHSVRVYFEDGKVWDIDIAKTKKKTPESDLEHILEELFMEYEDVIANVDFRLDTERLKSDIQKRTKYFMKKRK